MAEDNLNVSEVTGDILCEFLEVAIHSILYTRQLYPLGTFNRRKKYNVPVQICMHPEVNQYTQKLLQSLKDYVKCNAVDKVMLAIVDTEGLPLERFVFELSHPSKALSEDTYLLRLEQALRDFLLKINVCDAVLTSLPEDCTWRVQVSVKEQEVLAMQEKQRIQDFTWVEADDRETRLPSARIIPLKAVDATVLKMQLYVEESGRKQ